MVRALAAERPRLAGFAEQVAAGGARDLASNGAAADAGSADHAGSSPGGLENGPSPSDRGGDP
jgi:hypothetical protein